MVGRTRLVGGVRPGLGAERAAELGPDLGRERRHRLDPRPLALRRGRGRHRGWPTTRVEDSSLGVRNAARFEARGSLDLRAEYRKPVSIGSFALTFEVTNAVNIGNTCCQNSLRTTTAMAA